MNVLDGRVAVVTGSSKGIGAGIARALAAAGAKVAVNFVTGRSDAEKVVAEIEAHGGIAHAIGADVSDEVQAGLLVAQTVEQFGRLDIVVNNAAHFRFGPVETIDLPEFRRHFEVNVFGAIQVVRHALPHLRPGSSIINIGSAGVDNPTPDAVLYGSSKAAIERMSLFMSKELGPREIRVNVVRPGATDTEGNRRAGSMDDERVMAALVEHTALGRIGFPEDIAPAVVFLASDDARWITGATLDVSGGFG